MVMRLRHGDARDYRRMLLGFLLLLAGGCATTPAVPLRVNVASVERIDGAAMELRFMARLRIQNANDAVIGFSGAAADLYLNGKPIGSGVRDVTGVVPRFGEIQIDLPITVSALGEIRNAIGLYGAPDRKLDVVLRGRLAGPFDYFRSNGAGNWPCQSLTDGDRLRVTRPTPAFKPPRLASRTANP